MSQKISVVSISLALLSLMLFSCARRDNSYFSAFEKPFTASVTVLSAGGEYRASVSLAEIETVGTDESSDEAKEKGSQLRGGSISYTYPESVTGISASRSGGEVCVNVCGIDVRPSENIACRYTYLIDLLDIRSDGVLNSGEGQYEGKDAVVFCYSFGEEETTVYMDRESKLPIMLKNATVALYFDSFTYL